MDSRGSHICDQIMSVQKYCCELHRIFKLFKAKSQLYKKTFFCLVVFMVKALIPLKTVYCRFDFHLGHLYHPVCYRIFSESAPRIGKKIVLSLGDLLQLHITLVDKVVTIHIIRHMDANKNIGKHFHTLILFPLFCLAFRAFIQQSKPTNVLALFS